MAETDGAHGGAKHGRSKDPVERSPRLSIRFLERVAQPATASKKSALSSAAPLKTSDPIFVLRALDEKLRKLRQSISALEAILDVMVDPEQRARVSEQLDEAVRERDLCRARFSQIDHGGPFKAPPEGELARLLAAIRTVSDRLGDTKNWEALLGAVHGLVEAYAAKSTKA